MDTYVPSYPSPFPPILPPGSIRRELPGCGVLGYVAGTYRGECSDIRSSCGMTPLLWGRMPSLHPSYYTWMQSRTLQSKLRKTIVVVTVVSGIQSHVTCRPCVGLLDNGPGGQRSQSRCTPRLGKGCRLSNPSNPEPCALARREEGIGITFDHTDYFHLRERLPDVGEIHTSHHNVLRFHYLLPPHNTLHSKIL
jgi:hypothetical protein